MMKASMYNIVIVILFDISIYYEYLLNVITTPSFAIIILYIL